MEFYINAVTQKLSNSCFASVNTINSVDLSNVEFVNNSMVDTFRAFRNLTSVTNINNNVTYMGTAFQNCTNLVNGPTLPTNLVDLGGGFAECYNLVNAPVLPDSIELLAYAFANCYNMSEAPVIPNNVITLYGTFVNCYNITNAADMSNATNVTDMVITYQNCHNLRNVPDMSNATNLTNMTAIFGDCINLVNVGNLPNSPTNIREIFRGCTNLVNSPVLPSNAQDMSGAYAWCYNLANVPDLDYISAPTNIAGLFYNCTNLVNAPALPSSAFTAKESFYGCSNLINGAAIPDTTTDMIRTFQGCSKLTNVPSIGNSVTNMLDSFKFCTNLTDVPAIPDTVVNLCGAFSGSGLVNAPVINNSTSNITNMSWTYDNCYNLVNPSIIPDDVTDLQYSYHNCFNLASIPNIPNKVTNLAWAFRACYVPTDCPNIPDSVTNMYGAFCVCDRMVNGPTIGRNVTDMRSAFGYCPNLVGDIIIQSEKVSAASSCFMYSNASKHKDVYIPFKYANNVNTITYNAFTSAGYTTTGSSQGVYLRDLAYYNTSQTINVTTNPAEATVTFNSSDPNAVISGNSITAKSYSSLTITASYTGYNNKVEIIDPFGPWTNDISLTLTPEGQFAPGPYTADSGLTENNLVYSNFANTTGIQVPSTYDVIGNEIVVKFRLTKDKDSEAYGDKFLFGQDSLDLYIADGDIIKFYTRNGPVTVLTPERNVWYWIKCKVTSSNYMIISTSTDGSTWTSLGEQSYWGTLSNRPIVMGAMNATSTERPFPGEIDMSAFRVYDSNGDSIWGTE